MEKSAPALLPAVNVAMYGFFNVGYPPYPLVVAISPA
jgi:hypothetical protein